MSISDLVINKFSSNDIIYHYTKASTAIDYILFNKKLKLSQCTKSNDPIECLLPNLPIVSTSNDEVSKSQCDRLRAFYSYLKTRLYQVSFCKNVSNLDFASKYYHGSFEGHEECFGFTKPRMWEQYSENYSGVCLAFSKEKILTLNNGDANLITGDVKYFTNMELSAMKTEIINSDALNKIGFDWSC